MASRSHPDLLRVGMPTVTSALSCDGNCSVKRSMTSPRGQAFCTRPDPPLERISRLEPSLGRVRSEQMRSLPPPFAFTPLPTHDARRCLGRCAIGACDPETCRWPDPQPRFWEACRAVVTLRRPSRSCPRCSSTSGRRFTVSRRVEKICDTAVRLTAASRKMRRYGRIRRSSGVTAPGRGAAKRDAGSIGRKPGFAG